MRTDTAQVAQASRGQAARTSTAWSVRTNQCVAPDGIEGLTQAEGSDPIEPVCKDDPAPHRGVSVQVLQWPEPAPTRAEELGHHVGVAAHPDPVQIRASSPNGTRQPVRRRAGAIWGTLRVRQHRWLAHSLSRSANVERDMRSTVPVSYTHLRAHETVLDLVCRLLLE